jgi:hypothetical protein
MEGISLSHRKSKYNNSLSSEEIKARSIVMNLIGTHNPWINPDDLFDKDEIPIKMTDAEIYYIASVIMDLETIKQQRSLIDVLHIKCDDDTIYRFISYIPPDALNHMMLTC